MSVRRVFGQSVVSNVTKSTSKTTTTKQVKKPVVKQETFSDDYNITLLHKRILESFTKEEEKLPVLQKDLDLAISKSKSTTISLGDYRNLVVKIEKIQTAIKEIHEKKERYMVESADLLARYELLSQRKNPKVFGATKEKDENSAERSLIIMEYLNLAREYIPVKVQYNAREVASCHTCGEPLGDTRVDQLIVCQKCDTIIEKFGVEAVYRDGDKVMTSSSRSNYFIAEHIKNSFLEYQGKQNNKVPSNVIKELTDIVNSYNISLDELTPQTLYQILKDKRYNTYYNSVNSIYHEITGKPLPNLEDIEPDLDRDIHDFASIYHDIKPANRSNCLNADFIRSVFLKRYDRFDPFWQCTFLRTGEVADNHGIVMKKAFEKLEWGKYTSL